MKLWLAVGETVCAVALRCWWQDDACWALCCQRLLSGMYVCIMKGQGFISPVDTGRQQAHTPSPSEPTPYRTSRGHEWETNPSTLSLQCSPEISRPLSHRGRPTLRYTDSCQSAVHTLPAAELCVEAKMKRHFFVKTIDKLINWGRAERAVGPVARG